jgi:hypothetical protein
MHKQSGIIMEAILIMALLGALLEMWWELDIMQILVS